MNLDLGSIFVHASKGSLTCRKVSRCGTDGFTSSPKEGVLRIFIALEHPSPSAGSESVSLRSNGKHVNHYTTENDYPLKIHQCIISWSRVDWYKFCIHLKSLDV
jgi:hypothetical protein